MNSGDIHNMGLPHVDIVEYLDDDRKETEPTLKILWSNVDGDFYISIRQKDTSTGLYSETDSVRLCASGGASSRVPGLRPCIAQAFKLIKKYMYP